MKRPLWPYFTDYFRENQEGLANGVTMDWHILCITPLGNENGPLFEGEQ